MAGEDEGQGAKLPEDARLDSLEQRLQRAQAREATRTAGPGRQEADEKAGSRVLSLLLGGIFGGSLIGWLADGWFGTGHVLLIVGLLFGVVGAFYSILKMAAPRKDAGTDKRI